MSASIPYVKKRNSTYYYVRRLPNEFTGSPVATQVFGKSLTFRRSLKTKCYRKAIEQVPGIEKVFDQMVLKVKEFDVSSVNSSRRKVDAAVLERARVEQSNAIQNQYINLRLNAELSDVGLKEYQHRKQLLEENAGRLRSILLEPRVSTNEFDLFDPIQTAKAFIRSNGLDIKDKRAIAELLISIKKGAFEGFEKAFEIIQGDRVPSPILDSYVANEPHSIPSSNPSTPSITFSEVITNYLGHKTFPPRTQTEVRSAAKQFCDLHGDLAMEKISLSHVRKLIERMGERIIGSKSIDAVERRISPDTVKKSIRLLSAAVNHSIAVGDFEGKNHFNSKIVSKIVPPQDRSVMPEKRPFEIGELNKIFCHPWFLGCQSSKHRHKIGKFRLDDMFFWAPIVALFTGCRVSEIAGLKLVEIKIDDSEPFPHFNITPNEYRNVKKDKQRFVPIHPHLIHLGFQRYYNKIKSSGSDRLFPDWTPTRDKSGKIDKSDQAWANCRVINSFNQEVIPMTLGIPRGKTRQAVTFHSFRGTYKTMLQLAKHGIPNNAVNQVCGHSLDGMDKHYIKTVPLSETYPLVAKTAYPKFNLPPAPE